MIEKHEEQAAASRSKQSEKRGNQSCCWRYKYLPNSYLLRLSYFLRLQVMRTSLIVSRIVALQDR
jgi:hypothetical protein